MAGVATSYSYTYDPLNRLTQVANGNVAQQENYAYDPLGNRTTKTVNATTPSVTAYVYDAANQLKEIHRRHGSGPLLVSLGYDANGSLTSRSDTDWPGLRRAEPPHPSNCGRAGIGLCL